MTTKAQQWAQKRNFSKKQLLNARAVLRAMQRNDTCTSKELFETDLALSHMDNAIRSWNSSNRRSKLMYIGK